MKKYSFPPLSDFNATIVILGTMPGEQSLAKQEYYGNLRNNFWKIMQLLLKGKATSNYQEKTQLLLQNKIALWDVLNNCERSGSLDSAIKNEIPNDFATFLKLHPKITIIAFNGQKAAALFHKHITLSETYQYITLPSTSPANASKSFENKLKEWSILLPEKN